MTTLFEERRIGEDMRVESTNCKTYFEEMFLYEGWANRKILAYLETQPTDRQLIDIFGHLVAEIVPWLCLLRGETVPKTFDPLPHWSVEECSVQWKGVANSLDSVLQASTEEKFNRIIASPGPQGRSFQNTVAEILTHILSHGQHHRGQIEWLVEKEWGIYLGTSYMPYLRQRDRVFSPDLLPELPR